MLDGRSRVQCGDVTAYIAIKTPTSRHPKYSGGSYFLSWCSCSWAFDLVGQEKYEVVVEHWKQAVVAARAGELFFLEVTEGEDPTNILLEPHES